MLFLEVLVEFHVSLHVMENRQHYIALYRGVYAKYMHILLFTILYLRQLLPTMGKGRHLMPLLCRSRSDENSLYVYTEEILSIQ